MQSTSSPSRAPLLNLLLWGVPVLCSLFFATELLLAPQSSAATQAAPARSTKEPSKPTIATIEVATAPSTPPLTPQQIDELLAAIPKFSDRSVWDRRSSVAALDRMYKYLFVQLGLGFEKAAELRALLIERENARSRMHIALAKAGLSITDTLAATKEIMQRYDQKIERCLGPEEHKVFTHRTQNPGNYSLLDGVISSLSATEHPLPDDKKRELYAAVLKTPNDEAFMTAIYQALPAEQSHVLLEAIEAQTISDELYQMRMGIYRRNQTSTPN